MAIHSISEIDNIVNALVLNLRTLLRRINFDTKGLERSSSTHILAKWPLDTALATLPTRMGLPNF